MRRCTLRREGDWRSCEKDVDAPIFGSDMHSLRADVASDLLSLEKRMNDQFVALRRSVMEYHSTAVGHGLLYSELDERVRRIEQRLEMTPSDPH